MEFLVPAQRRSRAPAWRGGMIPRWWGVVLILFGGAALEAQTVREYQVKAAFLYNFAQFTEWPPEAFSRPESPLVVGILGEDPFGEALDKTMGDEVVRGHRIEIKRFRAVAEMPTCHIIYIGRSESSRLPQILKNLSGKPVLTVSDLEGAAEHGVIIQFTTEHSRIRFRINPAAARAANLTLSSKLLRVADIVTNKN